LEKLQEHKDELVRMYERQAKQILKRKVKKMKKTLNQGEKRWFLPFLCGEWS